MGGGWLLGIGSMKDDEGFEFDHKGPELGHEKPKIGHEKLELDPERELTYCSEPEPKL